MIEAQVSRSVLLSSSYKADSATDDRDVADESCLVSMDLSKPSSRLALTTTAVLHVNSPMLNILA